MQMSEFVAKAGEWLLIGNGPMHIQPQYAMTNVIAVYVHPSTPPPSLKIGLVFGWPAHGSAGQMESEFILRTKDKVWVRGFSSDVAITVVR